MNTQSLKYIGFYDRNWEEIEEIKVFYDAFMGRWQYLVETKNGKMGMNCSESCDPSFKSKKGTWELLGRRIKIF